MLLNIRVTHLDSSTKVNFETANWLSDKQVNNGKLLIMVNMVTE